MIKFDDLMVHINNIKDVILSDITYDESLESNDEEDKFMKHLHNTKLWYTRVSHANKKRYIIALLHDVSSAWTLSMMLKSIWNCQTKDAVLSANQKVPWSSYDQVPMDNNRTAMPLDELKETMLNDRKWFCTLSPENQAIVLMELLTVSGLPIMMDALKEGTAIYERYRQEQIDSIQDVVQPPEKTKDKDKDKDDTEKQSTEKDNPQLEAALATWNSVVKSFRDSLKMEELEVNLHDGSKKKVWLFNRPKPETFETLDYLQLLPSAIAKQIFTYIPLPQLSECAKVNKYWASLVDELKLEYTTRAKIDLELQKLQDLINQNEIKSSETAASTGQTSSSIDTSEDLELPKENLPSRSGYKNRIMVKRQVCKSILKLKEVAEKLDRRGAADENFFNWCDHIIKVTKRTTSHKSGAVNAKTKTTPKKNKPGIIDIPMKEPLTFDNIKCKKMTNYETMNITHEPLSLSDGEQTEKPRRYTLWNKNYCHLYPAFKILSYQAPF